MARAKGVSKAGDEVLDMIRRHGGATLQGVISYFDLNPATSMQRLQRLRKSGLIEKHERVGRIVVWREVVK